MDAQMTGFPVAMRALLVLALCALAGALASPAAFAWGDEGDQASDYCGYAYLDRASGGSGNELVIQKEARQERAGYRYLGRVPADSSKTREVPWLNIDFQKVSFKADVSSGGVNPLSTKGWFSGKSLTAVDFSGLDASRLVDASSMFEACRNLEAVSLSGLNAPNLVNLSQMFRSCPALGRVDFSNVKAPNARKLEEVFASCGSLSSVDLSGLEVCSGADLTDLFNGCQSLDSLSLAGFKASDPDSAKGMFRNCSKLESVDLSWCEHDSRQTGNGMVATGMFAGCRSLGSVGFPQGGVVFANVDDLFEGCCALSEVDLRNAAIAQDGSGGAAFNYCPLKKITIGSQFKSESALSSLFNIASTWKGPESEKVAAASRMIQLAGLAAGEAATFEPQGDPEGAFAYIEPVAGGEDSACMLVLCPERRDLPEGAREIGFAKGDYRPWEPIRDSIAAIRIDEDSQSGAKVELSDSAAGWFSGCSNARSVDGLENLDTSSATDLSNLFSGCSSLESLDLSGFDTASAKDLSGMFSGCSALTSLDVSGLDTSNVTNVTGLFSGCSSLTSLALKSPDGSRAFAAGSAAGLSGMFSNCSSLASLDLSGLDTSSATDLSHLFSGCSSLESLDLSGFDTASTKDMSGLFSGCSSLARLDVSTLDTSQVTTMTDLFSGCSSLATLVLKGDGDSQRFVTSRVTDMRGMFSGCSSLVRLDVSTLDTSNATVMEDLFSGCSSLESLDLACFSTQSGILLSGMFADCPKLDSVSVPVAMAVMPEFPAGMWKAEGDGVELRYDRIPGSTTARYRRSDGTPHYWARLSGGTLTVSDASPADGDRIYAVEDNSYYEKAADVPWRGEVSSITKAVVEGDVHPRNAAHWFSGCANLQEADLAGLTATTSLRGLFDGCSSLTSVSMPNLDTSSTDDFSHLFRGCRSLASLDLSNFDTTNATSMKRMLHGCRSLSKVTLGERFSFFGCAVSRLPGSELPSGTWRNASESSKAWASDSLPNFTAATYVKVPEGEEKDYTVVSVRGDAVAPTTKYTVETTYAEEAGKLVAESSYELDEGYDPAVPLVIGGSAKASSVSSTTVKDSSITRAKLKKLVGNVSTVVLGSSVSSVGSRAFADARSVRTVRVESSRLNSATKVKGCLYGSNVRTLTFKAGLSKVQGVFKSYAWKA